MTYSPAFYNTTSYKEKRRRLRKDQTKAESLLWKHIKAKKLGCKFRRQCQIGPFIVDFCCYSNRFIIELDGNIHEGRQEQDRKRQQYLEAQGFFVLRILNDRIFEDLDSVLANIINTVGNLPSPLLRGGE